MADRRVSVTLTANVEGFTAAMGRAASSAEKAGLMIGRSIDGHKDSLNTVGNAALGMGAALVVGVGLAVKSFMAFDKQMSAVQAATGETDANMVRLRDTAMQLGADTSFSAREAAQGMEELAKAGVSTNDIIGGGLKGSLDLAAAGGLSVAEAAETAATALTQFGLSGSDVGHVADLLAAGAGKAQGSVHDLGMALGQAGLVAAQYGVSIEETTGTLAAFAAAGLIGSDAGTSFKTMLMRMAAPTGEAAKLMDRLGISAYDASGSFVSMSDLAGQLQTSMSGMSESQRNAAMATLFGSDAVRAANVLYTEGAAGIAGWTAAVDQQGYAAETAAARMDNLAGDLEKLGGAFETMMIQMGGGADGPLRGLVQGITSVVEAFGKLPAPVQQGVMVVAALAGAGLLAAGGLIKGVVAASDLMGALTSLRPAAANADAAFNNMASSSGKAGTAMRLLGGYAAAAGIALAALWAAGQITNRIFKEATPSVEEYSTALGRLGSGGAESINAMNTAIVASGANMGSWTNKVTDLDSAFVALKGNSNVFNEIIAGVGSMVGMNTQLSVLRDQFSQIDVSLKGMSANDAAASFTALAASAEKAGFSTAELTTIFPEYASQVRAAAAAQGITITSLDQLGELMASGIPAAAGATTGALGGMAGVMEANAESAAKASEAMRGWANNMLAMSGSMIGVQAAIDEATASIAENGKTLDINTAAGRANQSALDQIAAANLKYMESAEAAGASTETVTANVLASREAFITAAQAAGMNAESAAWLADSYGLIPPAVTTQVTAPGAVQSKAEADAVRAALATLPPSTQTAVSTPGAVLSKQQADEVTAALGRIPGTTPAAIVTTANLAGISVAQAALMSVKDRTVYINTIYRTYGKIAGVTGPGGMTIADGGMIPQISGGASGTAAHYGPGVQRFADAGMVRGHSPHPRADNIPAWLTAGEIVHSNATGDRYGRGRLLALNDGRVNPRDFAAFMSAQGLADGGPAGSARPIYRERATGTSTTIVQQPQGMNPRDYENAVLRAINRADVVMVRRSDYSLIGGGIS